MIHDSADIIKMGKENMLTELTMTMGNRILSRTSR